MGMKVPSDAKHPAKAEPPLLESYTPKCVRQTSDEVIDAATLASGLCSSI
jgi:hypothetical protein